MKVGKQYYFLFSYTQAFLYFENLVSTQDRCPLGQIVHTCGRSKLKHSYVDKQQTQCLFAGGVPYIASVYQERLRYIRWQFYLVLSQCETHGFLLFSALLDMSLVCPTTAHIFFALEMKLGVAAQPTKRQSCYKDIVMILTFSNLKS